MSLKSIEERKTYYKEYYRLNKYRWKTYKTKDRTHHGKVYYEKHKEELLAKRKVRFEANKAFIREAKNVPCMDCKQHFPYYVMDFDHVRGKKFKDVSQMVHFHNLNKIKDEVAKCDVVCSNCHRIRTHKRTD